MDIAKIKVGKRVAYRTSHGTVGKGKVTDIALKLTGTWVTIDDPTRNRYFTVRPSQVRSA